MLRTAPFLAIAATLCAHPACADTLAVGNASFEEPALPDGTNLAGFGAPWMVSVATGVPPPLTENPSGAGTGVVDGEQRIRLRTSSSGSSMILHQTLSAVYAQDVVYVFSITPIDFDGSLIPQFQILLDGLSARTVTSSQLIDALGKEIGVSGTVLAGDPLIGQNVKISIGVSGQGFNYGAISFDLARVRTVPIPEPSTAPLVGLGLMALIPRRRAIRSSDHEKSPCG